MTITTCIFDAYGTLFDVDAAARAVAKQPGQAQLAAVWATLAADWRRKQLEYSWLRSVAGRHISFWQVTQDALDWALDNNGLHSNALRAQLLAIYKECPAFPEVANCLKKLKKRGMNIAILSNGSPDMLVPAVRASGIGAYLDDVLSVEDTQIYKPHHRVYDLVWERFDVPQSEVLFASSNGWDIAGASGYGFATVWVNRHDAPPDRLWAAPHRTLKNLKTLPDLV